MASTNGSQPPDSVSDPFGLRTFSGADGIDFHRSNEDWDEKGDRINTFHLDPQKRYTCKVAPPWPIQERHKREELDHAVKIGRLKKLIAPRYDTLVIKPGDNLTEQVAFCEPYYRRGGWNQAETNMSLAGMLGTPCQGLFQYLRVHFEKYHSLEDAVAWKERASISFNMGYERMGVWTGALGGMDPILPRGGSKKIEKFIKMGVIRFWPWYEIKLPDTVIDSTECFNVKVQYSSPFSPQNEMRIKLSLGPWFFQP